jgi:hypothetical protein
MRDSAGRELSLRELILVPSLITLAVTVLRLVGELNDWSPALFGKQAGGGGSLVGIAWLVPVFGLYFAVKLIRAGQGPGGAGRAAAWPLLAVLVMVATGFVAGGLLKLPQLAMLLLFAVVSFVAVAIAQRGWPALGRVLVGYGLAARVPVTIVMLVAMLGNWRTHYDVSPPDWPGIDQMNVFAKWLTIGVLPQLTVWIAYTVVIGILFGSIAAALMARGARSASA